MVKGVGRKFSGGGGGAIRIEPALTTKNGRVIEVWSFKRESVKIQEKGMPPYPLCLLPRPWFRLNKRYYENKKLKLYFSLAKYLVLIPLMFDSKGPFAVRQSPILFINLLDNYVKFF